jgi:protein-S-isoprenylcysteine O-methyltransferase Ste14
MTSQIMLLIIAVTWGVLLVLYGINNLLARDLWLKHALVITRPTLSLPATPPGSLHSKSGVLFIFMVNIVTIGLLVFDALSISEIQCLAFIKINFQLWVNITGSVLFVLGTLGGFFAMIFNPTYTPLYKLPPEKFILANQGPYALTRHPRYVTEALLNISLFLLTGFWLPLLGLIGWLGLFHQAKAEEKYLMAMAPKEYGEYCERTTMFLPIRFSRQQGK